VFAALLDEEAFASKIAYIDASTAEAIFVAGIDASDDEKDDYARVDSLAWDEHSEMLWAAGPFGIRCWRRPTSA